MIGTADTTLALEASISRRNTAVFKHHSSLGYLLCKSLVTASTPCCLQYRKFPFPEKSYCQLVQDNTNLGEGGKQEQSERCLPPLPKSPRPGSPSSGDFRGGTQPLRVPAHPHTPAEEGCCLLLRRAQAGADLSAGHAHHSAGGGIAQRKRGRGSSSKNK